MADLESNRNSKYSNTNSRAWNETKFFLVNYVTIATFNFVQFILTIYGNHKLSTDPNHIDDYISNWNALRFDLAVACLTWLFLAYGLIRRFQPLLLPEYITSENEWDQAIADGIIWILQISAAIAQTVFVTTYFHCNVGCDNLSAGSYERNTAYTVFAWLLVVAWMPQVIWSTYTSRKL